MLVYPLIIIPAIVIFMVYWFDRTLIFGSDGLTVSSFWTFAGVVIGYYGFSFSLYAALMVKSLSSKYFTNQLLPVVVKQLEAAHKNVVDLGQYKTTEVRADGFLEAITASLGSIDRMDISGIRWKKRRVRRSVRKLSKYISDETRPPKTLIDIKQFVELRQHLNGLHLELKTRIKEGRLK